MKKIIAVNAGPRKTWNTAQLVRAAAEGAAMAGAETEVIDLYSIGPFTGCLSCFGCKRGENTGKCILNDALTPVLEKIRTADGLIIGTPNYVGEATSGFRAVYERMIFQNVTYNTEQPNYNEHLIPVLFIMTSNMPDDSYEEGGIYHDIVKVYAERFQAVIGPTETLTVGDTKQVEDYSLYSWTRFDAAHKLARHETVFPEKLEAAKAAGKRLASAGE